MHSGFSPSLDKQRRLRNRLKKRKLIAERNMRARNRSKLGPIDEFKDWLATEAEPIEVGDLVDAIKAPERMAAEYRRAMSDNFNRTLEKMNLKRVHNRPENNDLHE